MTHSNDDMIGWLMIGLVVVLIAGMTLWAAAYRCHARWEASGIDSRYQLFGGCQVQTQPGRWIPDDRLREVVETNPLPSMMPSHP